MREILCFVAGVGCGLWLYHYALGQAGWLGKLAAKKAEKKLKKIGLSIVTAETKPEDQPGHKSNLRYGKHRSRKD